MTVLTTTTDSYIKHLRLAGAQVTVTFRDHPASESYPPYIGSVSSVKDR